MKFELEQKDLEAIATGVVDQLRPLLKNTSGTDVDDTIFTVESLSEYLHVSEQWVYERVQLKEVPYAKVGKFLRFKKKVIDKWLDEQTTPAVNPLTRRLKMARGTGYA